MPMPKPVCRTFLYNKIAQLEVCRTCSGRGMGINGTAHSLVALQEAQGLCNRDRNAGVVSYVYVYMYMYMYMYVYIYIMYVYIYIYIYMYVLICVSGYNIYIYIYIYIYLFSRGCPAVVPPLLAYAMLKKVLSPAREHMF